MFKLAALLPSFMVIRSVAAQSSLYVWNNCGDTIWAHEVYAGYSQVYALGPQSGAFLSVPPDNNGVGQ